MNELFVIQEGKVPGNIPGVGLPLEVSVLAVATQVSRRYVVKGVCDVYIFIDRIDRYTIRYAYVLLRVILDEVGGGEHRGVSSECLCGS